MALKWQAPPGTNFNNTFYTFLKTLEGPAPGTGDLLQLISVKNKHTIGIGYDMVTINAQLFSLYGSPSKEPA
jgi:hypothetical protein